MSNKKMIVKHVSEVRNMVEKKYGVGESLSNMSFKSANLMYTYGALFGLSVEIIKGTFKGETHYWNVVDGFMVDLTTDNFGIDFSPIVMVKQVYNYEWKETLKESSENIEKIAKTDREDCYFLIEEQDYMIGSAS